MHALYPAFVIASPLGVVLIEIFSSCAKIFYSIVGSITVDVVNFIGQP